MDHIELTRNAIYQHVHPMEWLHILKKICHLDTKILNDNALEATILSFYHKKLPIVIHYIRIYISPKSKYNNVIQKLEKVISSLDFKNIIIIIGHFNIKSILNHTLIKHMKDMCNFEQYITQNTTSHQSQLDLCFANRHMNTTAIWNYWSDHHIISGSVKVMPLNND